MAAAHAAAAPAGLPLWRHLAASGAGRLPLARDPDLRRRRHMPAARRRAGLPGDRPGARLREALDWTAEVYRAGRRNHGRARGLLQGVADEGGFWPAFAANEDALEMLVRAIEKAG
jgi:enolase